MNEWNVQKPQKTCFICTKEFIAGDTLYSGIADAGSNFIRKDYCTICWGKSSKDDLFSYWKSVIPQKEEKRKENIDAVIDFFKELISNPEWDENRAKIKYILSLILLRRKRLKLIKTFTKADFDVMVFEKSWDGDTVDVRDPKINEQELDTLKIQLEQLFDCEFKPETQN